MNIIDPRDENGNKLLTEKDLKDCLKREDIKEVIETVNEAITTANEKLVSIDIPSLVDYPKLSNVFTEDNTFEGRVKFCGKVEGLKWSDLDGIPTVEQAGTATGNLEIGKATLEKGKKGELTVNSTADVIFNLPFYKVTLKCSDIEYSSNKFKYKKHSELDSTLSQLAEDVNKIKERLGL